MPAQPNSSRLRFRAYLRDLARRRKAGELATGSSPHVEGRSAGARQRSFPTLMRRFLGLLRGMWWQIGFALVTLTVSTLLKLVPPMATKITIDNVLGGKPLAGE